MPTLALIGVIGLLLMSGSGTTVQSSRPFAAESGRLRVEGGHFRDERGQVWRWRGATQFLLFARYLNGEDITPQLDWLVARGFNIVRVFGEVPAGFGADAVGVKGYERPFERADFDQKLHAFFTLLAGRGLRCEYTVLTYWDALRTMRAHIQRVFDVAASHWNVVVEVANEPEHNQIDAVAVMEGIDRKGVLAAYGLDPARAQPDAWKTLRVLDYGTTHDLDRNLEASPVNTRNAATMQRAFGVPFVNDEPIGAIDPGSPMFKQTGPQMYGGIQGGGTRTVNRDVFVSGAALAYMFSAGYTYHFQAGAEGRVPGFGQPIQDAIARALRDVAAFIPDEIQLGAPLEAAVEGGFGVAHGGYQWVVVPKAPPDQSPVIPAGWRIDAVGPVPYVLRLSRN